MCKQCVIDQGPEMWWTGREIVAALGLAPEAAVSDDDENPPS